MRTWAAERVFQAPAAHVPAVPLLAQCLRDPDGAVRGAAAGQLTALRAVPAAAAAARRAAVDASASDSFPTRTAGIRCRVSDPEEGGDALAGQVADVLRQLVTASPGDDRELRPFLMALAARRG